MGVSWWVVLVGGIIVGQVTTLLHVAYWLGYSFVDPRLEEVVRRAVFVAIQDSLDQFSTIPSIPVDAGPFRRWRDYSVGCFECLPQYLGADLWHLLLPLPSEVRSQESGERLS